MGKNNKARRAEKSRKKKNSAKSKERLSNNAGLSVTSIRNDFSDFSDENKRKALEDISRASGEAYRKAIDELVKLIRRVDPLLLVAILSSYGLLVPIGRQGMANGKSDPIMPQAHIELLQALILSVPANELGGAVVVPDDVQMAKDLLQTAGVSFSHQRMNADMISASEQQTAITLVQEGLRANTQVVRNWGYFSQVKNIFFELYSDLDAGLEERFGFNSRDASSLFECIIDRIESASSKRFGILKDLYRSKNQEALILAYYKHLDLSRYEAIHFIKEMKVQKRAFKEVFSMVMSHMDLRLDENFVFSLNDIVVGLNLPTAKVECMLERFSYSLGDLAESSVDHFSLKNPIWERPLIRLPSGQYFCALPQVFFSFCLDIFDSLALEVNKDALHLRRAVFLEKKIEEIVLRRFPSATTKVNIKWKDGDAEYESDLITFVDSYALIIEAKSGKITDAALRGAPDRIRRHLKEILLDPNEQSRRLREKLHEVMAGIDPSNSLVRQLPGIEGIKRIVRLSVSLNDFGSLQANIAGLKKTGWLPEDFEACPTMTLADFETLFDLLEHPVQIINYVERRAELEQSTPYFGDELDLMGLYVSTLFNIDSLRDDSSNTIITGMSSAIDNYYNSRDHGVLIKKPQPQLAPFFVEILRQLEERGAPRWTEMGVILHRILPADQKKMEKMLARIEANLRKGGGKLECDNMLVHIPSPSSIYSFCYVLYRDENSSERDKFISNACDMGLQADHVKYCLVLARNIDKTDFAYHFIGLFEADTVK